MTATLRELGAWRHSVWQARAPRERLLIALAAMLLGGALVLWFAGTVERSRTGLRAAVPALRAQADLLEQQAVEYERLRATPVAAASADLRALVQAQAGAAGLSRALVSTEAANANQVKVVFGAVAFADWLNWVAALETQRVRLEACRIEALATPGLISVTATLVRPQRQ